MADLVVGSNLPAADSPSGRTRRWPTTVHAVDAEQDGEPYKAMCGTFVIYRYDDDPWPPGIAEDWCPACVRLSKPEGWLAG